MARTRVKLGLVVVGRNDSSGYGAPMPPRLHDIVFPCLRFFVSGTRKHLRTLEARTPLVRFRVSQPHFAEQGRRRAATPSPPSSRDRKLRTPRRQADRRGAARALGRPSSGPLAKPRAPVQSTI